MKKNAVVLFNLGGPDSEDAIEPFLFNLFYDKSIIDLPNPFRFLLSKIISKLRAKIATTTYRLIGGRSPILSETEKQRDALESSLVKFGDYKVFICMRYWYPTSSDIIDDIKAYNPDIITALPLYPQFSRSTTASSVKSFRETIACSDLSNIDLNIIGCYYAHPLFIEAHASLIKLALDGMDDISDVKLIFSAHGLPKKNIDSGDPYQWQIEQSVDAIVKLLNINDLDYIVSYQSKVGPMRWLEPNTQDVIEEAAFDGKIIVVVPIAFVSEHVETLVELDIEYAEIAKNRGARYIRVQTLRDNILFIETLKQIIISSSDTQYDKSHASYNSGCPQRFTNCICRSAKL